MKIGIVIIATNSYFVLGIRFMKRFMHFYKGNAKIHFFFFSDTDPKPYLPENVEVSFYKTEHKNWQDGTNSKFSNILSLVDNLQECTHLYYFDADTNVDKDFTEEWFLGDMVGGEHYNNRYPQPRPYDRNPKSKAYVPRNTKLPQTYYYGAFFGGNIENMLNFCDLMLKNQQADKLINYEPGVNDESYINQHFHFNPPAKVVACHEFKFLISDKGGIGETRRTNLDIKNMKSKLLELKNVIFDIRNNKIVV